MDIDLSPFIGSSPRALLLQNNDKREFYLSNFMEDRDLLAGRLKGFPGAQRKRSTEILIPSSRHIGDWKRNLIIILRTYGPNLNTKDRVPSPGSDSGDLLSTSGNAKTQCL